MKIVTNGEKYWLWDKYEGFFGSPSFGLLGGGEFIPWEGDTYREAKIRLEMLNGKHTWRETEL